MKVEIAPQSGSPASIADRVMTSQDYKKVEHVRTWILSSSVANSNIFDPNVFFNFCLVYRLLDLRVWIFRQSLVKQGFFSLYILIFSCCSSWFFLCRRCFSLWLISFGKMKLPDVASVLTEKMFTVFSAIPALQLGRHFTGTVAETTSAIFPVKRR